MIEEVAAEVGVTKRDAEAMVNEAVGAMVDALRALRPIEIRGFGSLGIRQRAARTGRNPKTGTAVNVPPKRICYVLVTT